MHRAPHRPHETSLPPYTIRAIESQNEYLEAEHIQREVWGIDDLDVVPSANLRAVHHAGGCLLGAFRDDVLIGLAYGFLALPHGEGMSGLGLHSHLLAVRPQARAAGVGRALKWSQRDWALVRGLDWIAWTFDPLQARNARLNLEHLGAIAATYLRDFYGPLAGPLGGDQPSDRLLALWRLRTRRVVERAEAWREATKNGEALRTPTPATPATPARSARHARQLRHSDDDLGAVVGGLDRSRCRR
jgi:predicted GNAT superfamily acetyltransferase